MLVGDEGEKNKALIPFSSEIKFNMIIRDMNEKIREPTNAQDNISVFLKGAPEKVICRCSKILVKGEEIAFSKSEQDAVEFGNKTFGRSGERVLAFAKCELDPEIYTKNVESV